MDGEKIVLNVCGEQREFEKGIPFSEIAKEYQKNFPDDIILASLNNRLLELHKRAKKSGDVAFVTTADNAGKKAYRRSVTLLMQKALHHLLGKEKSAVRVVCCIS